MLRKIVERPRYTAAVINRKGGTGKTTVTINLAGELVLRGYNVGIVDMDSQPGNATLFLGMEREDGLFNALVGIEHGNQYIPLALGQVVRTVPFDSYYAQPAYIENGEVVHPAEEEAIGNFYILPSSTNTYRIPFMLPDLYKFHDLIEAFYDQYDLDFVIIDSAPTLSMLDGAVYDAADGFIYVTDPEVAALAGLEEAYEQVERISRYRVREGRRPSQVLGIVPNKVRSLREHVDNLTILKQAFPDEIWNIIRLLKNYSKATKYGATIRAYAPNTTEAYEFLSLVERFESEVMKCLV